MKRRCCGCWLCRRACGVRHHMFAEPLLVTKRRDTFPANGIIPSTTQSFNHFLPNGAAGLTPVIEKKDSKLPQDL